MIDRERITILFEIWLGFLDAYKESHDDADLDAAIAAYYDWVVALGIDEWPQFAKMELERIEAMPIGWRLKARGVTNVMQNLMAARKRAGKAASESQAAFDSWMLAANMLAALDKRPGPDRALAETLFNDMHFEIAEADRLPPGLQRDALATRMLDRYYDLAVLLRMDTMPGVVKGMIDKAVAPHGVALHPRIHRKLLSAARRRASQ